MAKKRWLRDRDQEWYRQQDNDKKYIEENSMPTYTPVLEGFLNDNSEGQQKNAKAPKYRSSGSGKSAIVVTQDIPAGSVIAFAAWGGKGKFGSYISLKGQLVEADHMPQQSQPTQTQSAGVDTTPQQPDFDDDIPF